LLTLEGSYRKTAADYPVRDSSYDGFMQKLNRIGIALATSLAAGFLGACIGFLIVRLVIERLGVVEGPPAGVLLVLVVVILALVSAVVGFALRFRWLSAEGRRNAQCIMKERRNEMSEPCSSQARPFPSMRRRQLSHSFR